MKKITFIVFVALLGIVSCKEDATSTTKSVKNLSNVSVDKDSESEKFSYSIGMIIANTLKNNGIDSIDYGIVNRAFDDSENDQVAYSLISREVQNLIGEQVDLAQVDEDIIKRAMNDVFAEDSTVLNLEEVQTSYRSFLQNNQTKIGEENMQKGKTFLESKKAEEGMSVTNTGLYHELIEEGAGEIPKKSDVLEVQFTGTTIDGEEFLETPANNPAYIDLSDPTSEIAGLIEGLQLYPTGSEFKLYVPSNLAFGANRMSPEVGPNSTVIFHIKDVKIMDAEKKREYKNQKKLYIEQMQKMQNQQLGR